ncbi:MULTISPECIES: aromatic ring-hydroxylating oxygenase subunit alpha [Sphingobium]|uniref:aromatic ring-hydroxylating oxygenase subunit alpha n=1 Tax=Sphingobium TaxID=165695 RepID=UPI00159BF3C3|nr:aromatic ring-hydroxylating dioxygenase subunit alpha [Sphingobium sp. 15-1]
MSDLTYAEMRSLYDDLMELVRLKQPTMAPDVKRLPVTEYTDPDRWQREVKLFRTTPLVIAFSTELSEPGSYWARTMVGVPILLTRQKNGEVRMFLNACRHRGAKVAAEGQGTAARLTCIYHAWSYGLDGKLLSIAERNLFGDVDKACLGLTELAVEERDGLIWGMLTPGLALDLDDFLGPDMDAMIRKSRFDRFHIVDRMDLSAANWKLASEGYAESYHFISLHAKSFGTFVYPNILKFDSFGLHTRYLTPALGIENCDPTSMDDLKRFVQIAYTLFPSMEFAFASDTAFTDHGGGDRAITERLFVNQVLPGDSPDKSITLSRTMVTEGGLAPDREAETRNWAKMTHQTVRDEDYPVVQSSQDTLDCGAQEYFTFGRNEIALHHFHDTLHRLLDEESETPLQAAE